MTCALPLQLSSEKELLMTGSLDSTLRVSGEPLDLSSIPDYVINDRGTPSTTE